MKDRLEHLLSTIVADDTLHVRWVNTLSYLENCGARKIAACEHPTRVREEMLKHAAEEFRHAHYLKSQLARIATHPPEDYRLNDLLGGFASWHLLRRLEAQICRYLTHHQLSTSAYAYVLVTFAVERQAEQLYHTYDAVLRRTKSKITVRSILLEEEGHLNQMEEELTQLNHGCQHARSVLGLSVDLFDRWLEQLERSIGLHPVATSWLRVAST